MFYVFFCCPDCIWMRHHLQTPASLPLGKKPMYPFSETLCEPYSLSGCGGGVNDLHHCKKLWLSSHYAHWAIQLVLLVYSSNNFEVVLECPIYYHSWEFIQYFVTTHLWYSVVHQGYFVFWCVCVCIIMVYSKTWILWVWGKCEVQAMIIHVSVETNAWNRYYHNKKTEKLL
jgi:hypothetical protein